MKTLASLGLVAACFLASPAFAGPAGTGLTFTEEVAKKRAAQQRQQAAADCVALKAAAKTDASSKEALPEICRAS